MAGFLLNLETVSKLSVAVQTSIGKRVFLFNRLHYSERKVYRVNVFGQTRNRYFSMEYLDNEWVFARPELVEPWMEEALDELRDALKKHDR